MGLFNKFLNIVPCNCRSCNGAQYAIARISEEAELQGVYVTELRCTDANKGPVWDALGMEDHILVNGFGHGNHTTYTGDSETTIFDTVNCDILSGRIVYLLSCLTANELGPAIISAGGIAYGGYDISWTWMTADVNRDPYLDFFAEGFYRSSNEFPIALVQGATVFETRNRCIAEYNRWISIWETERGGDPNAAAAIKWLLHDRDGLVVLGDMNATAVAAGIITAMAVDVEPPPIANTGETFDFAGKLLEREPEVPLVGKTVYLSVDGMQVATTVTGADGGWAFEVTLAAGVHSVYAGFQGDEDYAPGFSHVYSVEVGLTAMAVTVKPPFSVDPGQMFPFSGVLTAGTMGIPNKPINLLLNGTLIATTTGSDGSWHFDVTIPTIGHYILQAEFPGDAEYTGVSTDRYFVAVGVLPFFGYTGESKIMRTSVSRITATIFTAPKDGIAESITFFSQHSYALNKMKSAIYDLDTKKLIAETEEREFLANGRKSWETFVLPTKPQLVAGKKYLFPVWASKSCASYQYYPGDFDYQYQEMEFVTYGKFPAVWQPLRISSRKALIYCSYKEVTMAIHDESQQQWSFEVLEELHGTTLKMVQKFASAAPGQSKDVNVGVICAMNGKNCDLTGHTVSVLDGSGNIIAQKPLQGWDEAHQCYVTGIFPVTAPTVPGTYAWAGHFPRQ